MRSPDGHSYVHERLAILASNKHARRGRNWQRHYNGEWLRRLGPYRLTGTVHHGTAHAWREGVPGEIAVRR